MNNELSNLKANPNEKIKDFNSIFNKLLDKIPATSTLGVDAQIEWYISPLPSYTAIFICDNLKEPFPVKEKNPCS